MLELSAVEKDIGGRPLLCDIHLRCVPAEVIVITGDNGSGKTTLLRIIAGLIEPTRGDVLICGCSLQREPVRAKAHLGYLPDGLDALPELLVSEFIALVATLKRKPDHQPMLVDQRWQELLGVNSTWSQRLRSLSFGQRKRVALLAALTGAPDLLILDEPTNGLDPAGIQLITTLIEERRNAALMTLLATNHPELESNIPASRYHLSSGKLVQLQRD